MAKNDSAKKSGSLGLKDIYLILYNLILAVGWLGILLLANKAFKTWNTKDDILKAKDLYKTVEFYLQIFQTAALLEVVHAATGLVRSNAVLVFLQVLSRLMVVWLITYFFEQSRSCVGFTIVCIAWPIAEIVRYVYYALNILDKMPHFIAWCRYSFFIVLYPVGVTGELICMYYAVDHLRDLNVRKNYSLLLPNKFNISFDMFYFIIFSMLLYIPVFPQLYGHMLKQRSKMLSPPAEQAKKKAA